MQHEFNPAEQTPNSVKEEYLNKSKEPPKQMSKEESEKMMKSMLPYMKLQDEYEELMLKAQERRTRQLELQVREVEAVGFLTEWKQGQDAANKQREEWNKLTPEQQEEWKKKAQEIYNEMKPAETATGE